MHAFRLCLIRFAVKFWLALLLADLLLGIIFLRKSLYFNRPFFAIIIGIVAALWPAYCLLGYNTGRWYREAFGFQYGDQEQTDKLEAVRNRTLWLPIFLLLLFANFFSSFSINTPLTDKKLLIFVDGKQVDEFTFTNPFSDQHITAVDPDKKTFSYGSW